MSASSQELTLPIFGGMHVARILFGRVTDEGALAKQSLNPKRREFLLVHLTPVSNASDAY